jgi:hypothetical protein
MSDATRNRASKGGEQGVNGEWYEGGKFLPSTERPKRKGSTPRRPARVEIEPGVWAEPREGMRPIWPSISDIVDGNARRENPNAPLIMYAGADPEYVGNREARIEAYNRGDRWFVPTT